MKTKILLSTCLLLVAGKLSFSQNIAVNTSGAAAAATNMFEVTQTSTAANMVAIYAINSGASPGNTGYGLYSTITGASATNIGGYFNASGGTNNYPGIFMGGNVGIGTAGPLSKLHILGTGEAAPVEGYDITNTNVGNVLRVDASGNAVYNGGVIEFGSGLGPGAYIKSGQVNGAQSRLYFGTYKGVNVMTPDLTINNDGYVGIGTTAPAAKLEVAGAVNAIRTNYLDIHGDNGGTSDRPYIRGMNDHLVIAPRSLAGVGNTMYICWPGDMGAGSTVNTRLQETLYISSTGSAGGGNVGIGTASPAAKLEVVGTPSVTIKIVDGNQGAGKVLTSDANGQGSWQPMSSGGCMTQYVQEFTVAGTYTWTWPATTSVVSVEMWGGGGGGSSGRYDPGEGFQFTAHGGNGGAAGAYMAKTNIPVSGDVVVTVGAGGTGGAGLNTCNTTNQGTNGGNSSFGTLLVAPGGTKGGNAVTPPATSGTLYEGTFGFQCTGGTCGGGVGAYMWSAGGAGGTAGQSSSSGNGNAYGGGGGGAGQGSGGNGGRGYEGQNGVAGGNGAAYGGGGGGGGGTGHYTAGAGCPGTYTSGAGGNGASGYVKVTWWE